MLSVNIDNIISNVVPAILGNSWRKYAAEEKEAVYFRFDCQLHDPKEYSIQEKFFIHVIITQNSEIYYCKNNDINPEIDEYEFYSSHDSASRYCSEFLNPIYFDACDEVNNKIAPINIRQQNFISDIRKIKVSSKKDPNDGYSRLITSVKG